MLYKDNWWDCGGIFGVNRLYAWCCIIYGWLYSDLLSSTFVSVSTEPVETSRWTEEEMEVAKKGKW